MSSVKRAAGATETAHRSATASLLHSTTSHFTWMWSDAGSGAHQDVSIYRPQPADGWFIVSDFAHGDYGKPAGSVLTVRQSGESEEPLLKPPIGFTQVWNDQGSGGDHNGAIWYPRPPSGYVSLGFVVGREYSAPKVDHYRCVARWLVEEAPVDAEIWSDKGSGAHKDVTLYRVAGGEGAFVAQGGYHNWTGTAYRLQGPR